MIVPNYLVTRSTLPDKERLRDDQDHLRRTWPALQAAHAAAKAMTLDKAGKNPPVPLHPGAAKFYKEKGVL